jgi:ribosomal protein S18 acetylase RimI-like enzyme
MVPFIRDGDLLTVQSAGVATLRVGNVILYRVDEERLAAHRVVGQRVEGACLILVVRGDAITGPGEEVATDRVLGRVVRVQRGARMLDLDRCARCAAARLWVAAAPLGPLSLEGLRKLRWLAAWFLCRLQGLRSYRRLARGLIGGRIKYRAALDEDALALSTLYGYGQMPEMVDPIGTWLEHLGSLEGCECVLVASLRHKIVGAALIEQCSEDRTSRPTWWIWGTLVGARYRGAGIGQGLVCRILEIAREGGAGGVYLRVSESNRAALALYRKTGFRPALAIEDGAHRYAESGGILLVHPMMPSRLSVSAAQSLRAARTQI